jgi:MOSC domain-containing protein YiiM
VIHIRHIFISPDHNYFGHHGMPAGETPMVEVRQVDCVAGSGLVGDRFFNFKPNYKGQVTFFALEVYERLCEQFNESSKPVSAFRRNIITSGIDLNSLIGEEFEIQGVRFRGCEESKPCHWMEQAFAPGAEAALAGNGGLRAKVLSNGSLTVG